MFESSKLGSRRLPRYPRVALPGEGESCFSRTGAQFAAHCPAPVGFAEAFVQAEALRAHEASSWGLGDVIARPRACLVGLPRLCARRSFCKRRRSAGSFQQQACHRNQGFVLRFKRQTSDVMLLPATIHRLSSWTNTLAACLGAHGVLGTSSQCSPSAECQTSFRFPPVPL